MAVYMCFRARTRLRYFASFCTFLGLTVAIVGLLRARSMIPANVFWLWNFIAEVISIVALTYTIVSVGNGFYPMAGKKNVFWRMAMAWIIVYALVAISNIALYAQKNFGSHYISGPELVALRSRIENLGIMDMSALVRQELVMQCKGLIPWGNLTETGVASWRQLSWTEQDVFARPQTTVYLVSQMLMLFTWGWVSLYLFIPLVRNHCHGPVGRPVDSDMMAVGAWYLGCLLILTTAYAVLNIYFCIVPESIYEQQAQALDLCIRITIGPIFFLPAPAFLIRFYRQHFKRFGKGGNDIGGGPGCRYGGRWRNDTPSNNGGFQGSFATADDLSGSVASPYSLNGSRTGHPDDRGCPNRASADDPTNLNINTSIKDKTNKQRQTSVGSVYDRMRAFHSRNRGTSMESNKMFSQDFEPEELHDGQCTTEDHARADSFDQYFSNMDSYGAGRMAEGSNSLQISPSYLNNHQGADPLIGLRPSSMEPQKPEPALTTNQGGWQLGRFMTSHDRAYNEKSEPNDGGNKSEDHQQEKNSGGINTTGTTGWEVGGWGHIRKTSEGNENSLSNPPELYPLPSPLSALPSTSAPSASRSTEEVVNRSAVANIHDSAQENSADQSSIPIHKLTGLQKQLAEYRSALLPVVLAMHGMEDRGPPSVTFDSRDGDEDDLRSNDNDSRHYRSRSRGDTAQATGPRYSLDELSPSRQHYSTGGPTTNTIAEVDEPEENARMTVHSVDPLHWSKLPPSPKFTPTLSGNDSYADSAHNQAAPSSYRAGPSIAKSGERPTSGFRKKWLPGRKSNDADRQGAPRKFELELSLPDESKSSKRNSIGISNTDAIQSNKGIKPRDNKRNVFSKVLSGGGQKSADRGRTSQDLNDQDKDYSTLDMEGKPANTMHGKPYVPATVEALAQASAAHLEDEDEDKGLQYYYPDPYYSLAEFKRPQSALLDQVGSRTTSRHPLSPTFSEVDMGSKAEAVFKSKLGPTSASELLVLSSDESPGAFSSKTPSVKTAKSSQSIKKSLKKDAAPSPIVATNTNPSVSVSTSVSSPSSVSHAQSSSSLGSLLSRTSSNSKKIGPKSKARGNRSKSDVAPSRSSMDNAASPTTVLPITATRKASIPSVPAITQPAKTSLSPPPRQSWTRSKSFQSSASAIALALFNDSPNSPSKPISIDTKLANEHGAGDAVVSSPNGARTSLSSSLGSPTSGSLSPTSSPTIETDELGRRIDKQAAPSSPPLSPPATSYNRLGGLKPRNQGPRKDSLDRENDPRGTAKDMAGFSTAAMDFRRAKGRHQRSVDNLASAYYYKRAAELNNKAPENGAGRKRERERGSSSSATPSGSAVPPPSPQPVSSGFSYYGTGTGTGEDSGRTSPILNAFPHSQSHRRDPLHYASGDYIPHYRKSKSSLEYSLPGGNPGTLPSKIGNDGENDRTNSITSLRLLADDPWTQAMVARAQSAGVGVGVGAGTGNGSSGSGVGVGGKHAQTYSYSTQYPGHSHSPSPSPILGGSGDVSENGGGSGASGARQSHVSYTRVTSPLSPEFYTRPSISRTESE
ncbi:hypothetical protein BGZ54_006177 [Gamsiella multidivaricata]|nr:hypothetical protein BGZ54_006177 [Gamsiella multidivaricata]